MRRRLLVSLAAAALLCAVVHAYGTAYGSWPTTVTAITYWVNPANQDGLQTAAILADLEAAAGVWDAQSDASVPTISYAGAHTRTAASVATGYLYNSKNEVLFSTAMDSGSMNAQTFIFHYGTEIVETDLVIYDAKLWFTGTAGCAAGYYLKQTATHEFGHVFGMGHSSIAAATMYASTGQCNTDVTLDADDIAGIEFLYKPGTTLTPPAAPTNLRVTSVGSASITLAWQDNSSDETAFSVERSPDGLTFAPVASLAAGTVAYTAGSLASSASYSFRVRASNASGNSAYSNVTSGTTTSAPPATTLTLAATAVTTGAGQSVNLSWRNSTLRTEVYRNSALLATTKLGALSYRDKVGTKNSPFTGALSYQVCVQGTTNCSNTAAVAF